VNYAERILRKTASTARPRHSMQRSSATNDPLAPPTGLLLTTRRGRRWRDLAEAYSAALGLDQMKREDVRARVRGLIWVTMQIEMLHDQSICDNAQLILHLQQEQRATLNELGLTVEPKPDDKPAPAPEPAPPSLTSHIAQRVQQR
jgi:hypothetical protein